MNYEEMQKEAGEQKDRIELRSEKVRNIMGQMPPFLIRWGNIILTVIFLLLIVAAYILLR